MADHRAAARFDTWLSGVEARHHADLTFAEIARSLRALSSTYVERRARLRSGAALSGLGKRAAFATFYAPLHFLLIREIVSALPAAAAIAGPLIDLGCGTGAAGAGWASACERPPALVGVDRHPWALEEAARTYRAFGLDGRVRRGDLGSVDLPRGRATLLAAFVLNELPDDARAHVQTALVERGTRGDGVLVVEPLARASAPWWRSWSERVVAAGGRVDEWRFRVPLPPSVAKLDRAAGLDHRELTARSAWLRV